MSLIDCEKIYYPENLPVSALKNTIKTAINEHQVTIISGSTGSGKTTQIPKMCLELGLGQKGMIGHTQPRRLAARTVASRIASELHVKLGEQVGYQIRFTDETNQNTQIKLMTDGILLNEIQTDPLLKKYDTLIIDEAHERSLNIDFILGYLRTLIPKRPDLKIIITSATIDSEKFATHFSINGEKAPIIEVSGRTYPVEIRYRPLIVENCENDYDNNEVSKEEYIDQVTGIINAVEELVQSGKGDILVFLSGEKDIKDTQLALEEHFNEKNDRYEILPVFSRQAVHQQMKIFNRPTYKTRIVLATNIAETSLTIPGIKYVIDPGLARISRYSNKTKVQRLPIEEISKASANQRSGRCGRTENGIAIRLYSEENYNNRQEYTQPEILRTSLAAVILKMVSLGLEDVENFPFIDKPDIKSIKNGVQLLKEIGAFKNVRLNTRSISHEHDDLNAQIKPTVQKKYAITKMGRLIAKMPIDPRLARMLLEADKNGCLNEVIVIVAALSMQDVRERPIDFEEEADMSHARFNASTSDFLTYLTLWRYFQLQSKLLSGSAFRKMCRKEFFHYLRVREWNDIVNQLIELSSNIGLRAEKISLPDISKKDFVNNDFSSSVSQINNFCKLSNNEIASLCVSFGKSKDTPDSDQIHCSLLVGLISSIGYFDERSRQFLGTRGSHFIIWPGSGLYGGKHQWVMCAEIVETSRVFARTVARIKPEWIEKYAKFLVKYNYSDPFWSKKAGATLVKEKVLLYGLPIISDRNVLLGRLDIENFDGISAKEYARESFIRNALVYGNWFTHHKFYKDNQRILRKAEELQSRGRNLGLIIDDEDIFRFYDERLPDDIVSARHFDYWWKKQSDKSILNFTDDFVYKQNISTKSFPETINAYGYSFPLKYVYDTHSDKDGITVRVPFEIVSKIMPDRFDWLVSGFLEDLVCALLRNLPKNVRKYLVPIPDFALQILNFFYSPKGSVENFYSDVERKFDTDNVINVTDKIKNFSGQFDDFKNLHRALQFEAVKAKSNINSDSDFVNNSVVSSRQVFKNRNVEEILSGKNYYLNDKLFDSFKQAIFCLKNIEISFDDFNVAMNKLPRYLRMNFVVVKNDKVLCSGRNLIVLQNQLAIDAEKKSKRNVNLNKIIKSSNSDFKSSSDCNGISNFSQNIFDFEKYIVELYDYLCSCKIKCDKKADHPLLSGGNFSFKILFKEKLEDKVACANKNISVQTYLCKYALIYSIYDSLKLPVKRITTRWNSYQTAMIALNPYNSLELFLKDCQILAIKHLFEIYFKNYVNNSCVENLSNKFCELTFFIAEKEYVGFKKYVQDHLEDMIYEIIKICVNIFDLNKKLINEQKSVKNMLLIHTVNNIKNNVNNIIYDGFLQECSMQKLRALPKLFEMYIYRLLKAKTNIQHDQNMMWKFNCLKEKVLDFLKNNSVRIMKKINSLDGLERFYSTLEMMLEEYSVSLYAQHLGTSIKVSDKRIMKYLEENCEK